MNYKETGFRAFYKQFVSMPLDAEKARVVEDFPGIEKAQGFLAYGYIDHIAGLTLEVLSLAVIDGENIEYLDPNDTISVKFRIDSVEETPFRYEPDKDGALRKKYARKVTMIDKCYKVSDEIEESRNLAFLDPCRHVHCIDDVMVYLVKRGLAGMELGWARIEGINTEEKTFFATLLIEPTQDFGVHKGESITFHIEKDDENDSAVCVCDLTEAPKEEDYLDGNLLKMFIKNYKEHLDEESMLKLLAFLRDCFLWVPCTAVMDKEDEKRLMKDVEEAKDNPDALIGKSFTNENPIRFIPDILNNGEGDYMPAFTTAEEMGEYGENFSKVQKHIFEIIALGRGNEKEISGVVIDAFTEPFVLPKDLWELLERIPSAFAPQKEE